MGLGFQIHNYFTLTRPLTGHVLPTYRACGLPILQFLTEIAVYLGNTTR